MLSGISLPCVSAITIEGDVFAVELRFHGNEDTTQAESPPSDSEARAHQEELAILTDLNLQLPEHNFRYFPKCSDKMLSGTRLDLIIPPNI